MKQSALWLLAFTLIGSSIGSSCGWAVESDLPEEYYQVSEAHMEEVVPTAAEIASGYLVPNQQLQFPALGWSTIDWNQVFLIGEKIIELVKRGQPVVNIKRDFVAVVPAGIQNWQQLAGWQMPVTKAYQLVVKNKLGVTAVSMRLKVSGMWGGSLGGRGQYLTNVVVVPSEVWVVWGWNLDVWSEHGEPVNTGSFEAPVAGLGFDVRYRAYTVLNEMNGTQDYFLTGDGQIRQAQ